MLLNHLAVFKVLSNQFLREFLVKYILISLFLSAILSEFLADVGELPELLSFLEPILKGIGILILRGSRLHEC